MNAEKSEALEAVDNFDKKCKRQQKKRTFSYYLEREEEAYRNNEILIVFDEEYVSSLKSLKKMKQKLVWQQDF